VKTCVAEPNWAIVPENVSVVVAGDVGVVGAVVALHPAIAASIAAVNSR
jgi:hypothetical protein